MRFGQNDKYIELLLNDPLYDIRSDGTVWSKAQSGREWRRIGSVDSWTGYHRIFYHKFVPLARIIYRKFVGELDPSMDIDHVDGDKNNNKPENLEQITHADNARRGRKAKLTMEQAEEIRAKYTGKHGQKEALAVEYGVHGTVIGRIIRREIWS